MLSDDEFRQLLVYFDRPWAGFRKVRKGVKKRVRRHMTALGCKTARQYLQKIDQDATQRAECERQLQVTISRFFRDRPLWEYLHNNILPELAERFPNGLQTWSAGCANGEEPYSLAMVWEALREKSGSLPIIHILATDVDPICLQRAKQGIYPKSSIKEVPEKYKHQWFRKKPGKSQWRIDDELQEHITWRTHQLLNTPPQQVFHLILLRNNLLTYYQGAAMEAAFSAIIDSLANRGILIIGSHEQPPALKILKRHEACPFVYMKNQAV